MKLFTSCLFIVLLSCALQAQNTFTISVKDQHTSTPIVGATVFIPSLKKGDITDIDGKVSIPNIPDGKFDIHFRYTGFEKRVLTFTFPLDASAVSEPVLMHESHDHMEEVTITSTRSSRTIEDIPTRVEVIAGEELAEKANMKPGDIQVLLNESTGIQTQQTSATSYNSSIRIQGLDGRYTQLIRDGLPLYSGFSGGLSLMQIAPLDLKQVEVIKGSSSTLYGGGAIAGIVNLVSKTPEESPELSFLLNGTSALGLDASGFYAEKFGKVGPPIFDSYNKGTTYDPADIGLTAIPKFDRFTLNPRIFYELDDRTEMSLGAIMIEENRLGGDIDYANGRQREGAYFEENETNRLSSQLNFKRRYGENAQLEVKNSISHFNRNIRIPDFNFGGNQLSSFSEVNYSSYNDQMEWVGGLNLWTEKFTQVDGSPTADLSFSNATYGAFLQNSWNATENFSIESGLRADYQTEYGFFLLPRIATMYKPTSALTLRLGGGLGYKTPTVFSEEAERIQFQNVIPIDPNLTIAERSLGGNFDINYRWSITERLGLSTNVLFFYTQINNPLMLRREGNMYAFVQPSGLVDTKGLELNMKWSYENLKLFFGYTLANVNERYDGTVTEFPLVARHRLNNVLMYEKHDDLRIGLEAYYFSPQQLSDGATGEAYWILGLMVEKSISEKVALFINFENFLDTRQTRFDTIYTGDISNPNFRDIYAPVDGFVTNGGLKIKLF